MNYQLLLGSVFLLVLVLFCAGFLYLLRRVVLALEGLVDVKRREIPASPRAFSQPTLEPVQKRETPISKVPDLPPEIIAPNLKRPPRVQGGFGSRTGESTDDPQP